MNSVADNREDGDSEEGCNSRKQLSRRMKKEGSGYPAKLKRMVAKARGAHDGWQSPKSRYEV